MTGPWQAGATGDVEEVRLPGGNVGGAIRVGESVRRQPGAWTPAVRALLEYLHDRVPGIPRVLGEDGKGREVLTYLPGHVVDVDTDLLTDGQLVSLLRWTRGFHEAVAGFAASYGGFTPAEILQAVPERIRLMLDWIPVAAAAGDAGMRTIMTAGEPRRRRGSGYANTA